MHPFALLLTLLTAAPTADPVVGRTIDDFSLREPGGIAHPLSECAGRPVAVVFLGVDCPLARLYTIELNQLVDEFAARGLVVWGIDANRHDSLRAIDDYARRHALRFPLLKDPGGVIAGRLGATRTPEAFLLDAQHIIRYHGRIDDRHVPGRQQAAAERRDLACAIEDCLAGREVGLASTPVRGCFIDQPKADRRIASPAVNYHQHIATLLERHCRECHRPGQVAPFPLTTYDEAAAWAETMAEVIAERRMPPWSADPGNGHFANERRLSADEQAAFVAWARAGAPVGPAVFTVPAKPATKERPDGWHIEPDAVVTMNAPFAVPATGLIEYQTIEVDPHFTADRWIQAAEVRPGNRNVLHHCTVFLTPPGQSGLFELGTLGSFCLVAYTPGTEPTRFPPGMAKLVPRGWKLTFVLHYVTIGSPQTDRTSLCLQFAEPHQVRHEVATRLLYDDNLQILPGAADHVVEKRWTTPKDALLLAMFPHMHLRGKAFEYAALYPDGSSELLLSVPHYDFNWQHRYELATPKRLPAGTTIRCTAHYDNSAGNPANPDPTATVLTGKLTTDEMFNGYFDIAAPRPTPARGWLWAVAACILGMALWSSWNRSAVSRRAG